MYLRGGGRVGVALLEVPRERGRDDDRERQPAGEQECPPLHVVRPPGLQQHPRHHIDTNVARNLPVKARSGGGVVKEGVRKRGEWRTHLHEQRRRRVECALLVLLVALPAAAFVRDGAGQRVNASDTKAEDEPPHSNEDVHLGGRAPRGERRKTRSDGGHGKRQCQRQGPTDSVANEAHCQHAQHAANEDRRTHRGIRPYWRRILVRKKK